MNNAGRNDSGVYSLDDDNRVRVSNNNKTSSGDIVKTFVICDPILSKCFDFFLSFFKDTNELKLYFFFYLLKILSKLKQTSTKYKKY